jgi:4-diphosphocytidyl-2-C-methyl-D-erythritol kinase
MAKIGLYDYLSISLKSAIIKESKPDHSEISEAFSASDTLRVENLIGAPFNQEALNDPGFLGSGNLILKALKAFRELTSYPPRPVSIHLKKRIPLGAGLAGGSSDAAAVLKILNQHQPVPPAALKGLALALGADVPFFLTDRPYYWADGVGERLSAYSGTIPGNVVLLVNPGLSLSTAEVFKQLGLTTHSNGCISLNASGRSTIGPVPGPTDVPSAAPVFGLNHLEKPAAAISPSVASLRRQLDDLSPAPTHWGMSGSGPTFWALYQESQAALEAQAALSQIDLWVRLVPLADNPRAET